MPIDTLGPPALPTPRSDLYLLRRGLTSVQAFRAWVTHKLAVRSWKPAAYLEDVFEDGFTLITLLEILSGKVRSAAASSSCCPSSLSPSRSNIDRRASRRANGGGDLALPPRFPLLIHLTTR